MKVAIVHDYIKEYGGAERVLESLHNVFPNAPIYTSVYLPKYLGPHRARFEKFDIRTSWAQNLPFKAKLISPLRLISPLIFSSFDFSKFDVVIVSATGAYSPNSINKKSAVQICYSHTPPRYLYGYATARNWKKNIITKIIGNLSIHFLRIVDHNSSQNVDYFIANSKNTKARIEKFYRKDAAVVYPPVDIGSKAEVEKGEYYLAGGRIARAKNPDLIIRAFLENGLPLKIFGKSFGGYEREIGDLLREKGSNVEYIGEINDDEKDRLMKGAKAFIFASVDEDFGIIPVEAMMNGTPVIAQKSGGVLETIVEGKTGVFFDDFTIESLNNAIKKFEKMKFNSTDIKKHAEKFGKKRFENEIREFVEKHA
jgi:glycosyltransferase involved in cell wall biosynthesis